MRVYILSVFIVVVLLIGCKKRKIQLADVDPATDGLSFLLKGVKEDALVSWGREDVELHCQLPESKNIVFRPTSFARQAFDYLLSFLDGRISDVKSCFLQIRVNPDSYSNIEWSASKNEPGLLYITQQVAINNTSIELQAIKTYENVALKVVDANCYTAIQAGQNCLDRRRIVLERPQLPWFTVVSGYEQAAGTSQPVEKTYIVTTNKPLDSSGTTKLIDVGNLRADLSAGNGPSQYSWFDFLTYEKFFLSMSHEQIVNFNVQKDAINVSSAFKPLHIRSLHYFGFSRVTKDFLDKFDRAVWYALVNAVNGSDTYKIVVGGANDLFYSPVRPNPDSYLDSENFFVKVKEKSASYRTYSAGGFFAAPGEDETDPCDGALADFVRLSQTQLVRQDVLRSLNSCAVYKEFFHQLSKRQWSLEFQYFLEDWHEQRI